jgi:hypothetical protein
MRWILLAVLAFPLVAGCQASQTAGPAGPSESMTARLKREGDALVARGDYVGAVTKFQLATQQEPGDVLLRYALGSALSYLERRDETATEFRWVVVHGASGSDEVRMARKWLVAAGISGFAGGGGREATSPPREVGKPIGHIAGTTEWPGVNYKERLIRGRVTLTGDDSRTRGVERARPFRLGDRFEFKDLPGGSYRLLAEAWGVTLWDQKVNVETGRDTEVQLNSASSSVLPSKFPDGVKPPEE